MPAPKTSRTLSSPFPFRRCLEASVTWIGSVPGGGGGGGDGELIVSPPPSLTGTQPFAVGVRCAVDQRAVVSVSFR